MNVLNEYRTLSRRRETASQLRSLTHRQLEDIGAFEAKNSDRFRGLIKGL